MKLKTKAPPEAGATRYQNTNPTLIAIGLSSKRISALTNNRVNTSPHCQSACLTPVKPKPDAYLMGAGIGAPSRFGPAFQHPGYLLLTDNRFNRHEPE